MTQSFMTYAVDDAALPALVTALESAGYEVTRPTVRALNLKVRIRENTGDEAEVKALVDRHAPNATAGPPTTLTRILVGYRDGYR